MPHHELDPHHSKLALLEHSVSEELVQNEAIFALFAHALAERGFTSDRPGLVVRPFYDPTLPAGIETLGLRKAEAVPMSLQIRIPTVSLWDTEPYVAAEYAYIKIGVTTDTELQSFVYDEANQLRERLDIASGDTLEWYRVLAVPSWKAAHHTMLDASRQNPAIRLDRAQGIWTDMPPDDYIEFDLQ